MLLLTRLTNYLKNQGLLVNISALVLILSVNAGVIYGLILLCLRVADNSEKPYYIFAIWGATLAVGIYMVVFVVEAFCTRNIIFNICKFVRSASSESAAVGCGYSSSEDGVYLELPEYNDLPSYFDPPSYCEAVRGAPPCYGAVCNESSESGTFPSTTLEGAGLVGETSVGRCVN